MLAHLDVALDASANRSRCGAVQQPAVLRGLHPILDPSRVVRTSLVVEVCALEWLGALNDIGLSSLASSC